MSRGCRKHGLRWWALYSYRPSEGWCKLCNSERKRRRYLNDAAYRAGILRRSLLRYGLSRLKEDR